VSLSRFEDLTLGQTFTTSETFDAATLDRFAALSGDTSPLHVNEQAARDLGFPGRVVYGFQALALLSRIVGRFFNNAICVSVEADFTNPAFCGDQIDVTAELVKIQPTIRSVTLRVRMMRASDMVVRGKLITRFLP
jgi:3-hydroxybutyryl-CoA dehydratase